MNNNYLTREELLSIAEKQVEGELERDDFDLKSYLKKFENDKLQLSPDFRILNFASNLKLIHSKIQKQFGKFHPQATINIGAKSIYNTKSFVVTFGFEGNGSQPKLRFLETLLWLQEQGKVEIEDLSDTATAEIKVIDAEFFKNDLKEKEAQKIPFRVVIDASGEIARIMSENDDIIDEFKYPNYNFTLLKEVNENDDKKIYWKDLYDEMYKVKHGKSHRDEGRNDTQKKTTVRNTVYGIQERLGNPDNFLDWNEGYVVKLFRD